MTDQQMDPLKFTQNYVLYPPLRMEGQSKTRFCPATFYITHLGEVSSFYILRGS